MTQIMNKKWKLWAQFATGSHGWCFSDTLKLNEAKQPPNFIIWRHHCYEVIILPSWVCDHQSSQNQCVLQKQSHFAGGTGRTSFWSKPHQCQTCLVGQPQWKRSLERKSKWWHFYNKVWWNQEKLVLSPAEGKCRQTWCLAQPWRCPSSCPQTGRTTSTSWYFYNRWETLPPQS